MSSGFVSGGTTEKPIERDDEWLKAQQEIEANRRRKEEASRQEDGKTLYEVLQNNKAAKQEAFEESIKLKNQFRNLDEDEIEFLDSVLESTRKKEEDVKRETTEQLDLFRRQQEEADKAKVDDTKAEGDPKSPEAGEGGWAVNARKRKRAKDKEGLKGVKLRKSSSTNEVPTKLREEAHELKEGKVTASSEIKLDGQTAEKSDSSPRAQAVATKAETISPAAKTETPKASSAPGLGLAGYSSDEEN